MKEHRWSGWPGAFCLDCGKEDLREVCASDHSWPNCERCNGTREINGLTCSWCLGSGVVPCCDSSVNGECLGSSMLWLKCQRRMPK